MKFELKTPAISKDAKFVPFSNLNFPLLAGGVRRLRRTGVARDEFKYPNVYKITKRYYKMARVLQ